jgi:hypothetical protein
MRRSRVISCDRMAAERTVNEAQTARSERSRHRDHTRRNGHEQLSGQVRRSRFTSGPSARRQQAEPAPVVLDAPRNEQRSCRHRATRETPLGSTASKKPTGRASSDCGMSAVRSRSMTAADPAIGDAQPGWILRRLGVARGTGAMVAPAKRRTGQCGNQPQRGRLRMQEVLQTAQRHPSETDRRIRKQFELAFRTVLQRE